MNYHATILKTYFGYLSMPTIVFGKSSNNSENGIDTSLFVQNFYLRTNFNESNIEEDIDIKNKLRIKNLSCPSESTVAACKFYFHSGLNDPSMNRNNTHVDCNDENLVNVQSVKVNSLPQLFESN